MEGLAGEGDRLMLGERLPEPCRLLCVMKSRLHIKQRLAF